MGAERPASFGDLPRNIGRYRILGRLGKGAMGVVYKAHDSLMERSVAIKIMMRDVEDDLEASARFYREARSAGQLAHPNIITIYDIGEDDGRPFIVMELLEGETLNKYLERPEAADIEAKIDLMIQMCRGLHAAHAHGIFHRDVKPGNLLVRPNGELKIVDFGIARLATSNMTASGLVVGTPDYMAPEQADGHEVDQRSDIFSAGAVFYFMLTGRKPFAAANMSAVLAKVQSADPLPLRDSEAPAPLAGLVMKALAKNPNDRYQTSGEMAAELLRLKREHEIEAGRSVEESAQRLHSLEAVAVQHRTLIEALAIDPLPADPEAGRLDLLARVASLAEPHRRKAAAELLAEVQKVQAAAVAQVDNWQRALQAITDGSRAAAEGRMPDATAQFELALRIEPLSTRAAAEAERSRRTMAEQRAIEERAEALLAEARKAVAEKRWQAAIVLCSDPIVLDSRAEQASALRRKAVDALEAETRERRSECERALGRAEALRRKKRFEEAASELERVRGLDPLAPDLHAFEDRLRTSIAEAEHETEVARQAADAIATARLDFSGGQRERERALAAIRSFHARVPDAGVAAEITRLETEAARIAAEERRAAEAAAHAAAAETALAAGDPQHALELAGRALAIDPGHALARKVSGLAGSELKRQAGAKARAATAARHLEDARQLIARGKLEKARALVSAAADIDPEGSEQNVLLARIEQEEARVAAEAERERLARQRARAIAPILERARVAEKERDYVRAAWTAENALAIDLNCAEAKDILRRAQAQIEAEPALEEETVDLTNTSGPSGDPDDTVSLTRPLGMWDRVTGVFKRWAQRGGTGVREREAAESKPAKTQAR